MSDQTASRRAYNLLIYSDDSNEARRITDALDALSQYQVVQKPAADFSKATSPDRSLVILDIGDGTMLADNDLLATRRRMSGTPLIIISGQITAEQMRQVVQLNAADLLTKPVDTHKLIETVGEQLNVVHAASKNIYGFVSCVGGAGATSLAINTVDVLCQRMRDARNATCLVDLDFATGSCGNFLDFNNDFDLEPILENPNRIDVELMDTVRKVHPSGFAVYSFKKPDLPFRPTGEELVLRMLDVLSFKYDYVVIDIPYYETPWKSAVLEGVTDLFLVTDLTIPSLRQTRDIYNRMRNHNGGDTARPMIVVNQHRLRTFFNLVSRRDVQKLFKNQSIAFVADDYRTMTEAINRGILPREVRSRSVFVKQATRVLRDHLKRKGRDLL